MPTRRRVPGALLVLAWALPAGGTTLEDCTTCAMVARAERVVSAACESVEARRDPRSGVVFTHVTLRLLEEMKGEGAGGVIRLRVVGGRDGRTATVVSLMPEFRAGEECILFLGPPNDLGFSTLAFARRGVLRVAQDEEGERRVRDPVTGFPGLGAARRPALDDVRAAIRGEVARLEREARGGGR